MANFQKRCSLFFQALITCAVCGVCSLGMAASYHSFKAVDPLQEVPPGALANVHMDDFVHAPGGKWWLCAACNSSAAVRAQRASHVVFFDCDYTPMLYCPDPLHVSLLALIDVCPVFTKRFSGFAHGHIRPESLISAAIVEWGTRGRDVYTDVPLDIMALLAHNITYNPLVASYQTVLEREGEAG